MDDYEKINLSVNNETQLSNLNDTDNNDTIQNTNTRVGDDPEKNDGFEGFRPF